MPAIGLGFLAIAATSRADFIAIANPTTITSPINLSAGTIDWAHFAVTSDPTSNGGVGMVFDHPAATGFSNVSGVNGGLGAYDVNSSAPVMTWTGGIPDISGSSHSWAFNTNNSQSGAGLSFTYGVAPGKTILNLYVDAYADLPTTPLPVELDASLSSGTDASNISNLPEFWSAGDQDGDYTIDVINSSALPESLTLTYYQTISQNGPGGNGSNVGIFGVSATAVPEPASLLFIVLVGPSLLGRRLSRRA